MKKIFFLFVLFFLVGELSSQMIDIEGPVSKRTIECGPKTPKEKKTVKYKKRTKLGYKRVESQKWTAGWTTTEFFTVKGRRYLCILKESVSSKYELNLNIHKVNSDGSIGQKTAEHQMGAGYTDVEFYTIKGETYIMQIMENGFRNGNNVFIYKMKANGKFGDYVAGYKWAQGWSTIEFFQIKGKTYLFLAKDKNRGSNVNVHIYQVYNNGSIGKRIEEHIMEGGLTETEFYTIGNTTYLMQLMEKGYGNSGYNVFIRKMNVNGTFGNMVSPYKWTEGWTTAEFFKKDGQTYLFLLKEKGKTKNNQNVYIYKMNVNGSVGKRVFYRSWTEGWTNVEFYRMNKKAYMLQLKEKGAGNSGYNVHINRMTNEVKKKKKAIK